MSIDDKIAQNKIDAERILEEGRKLEKEKKQADMPGFGDILLCDGKEGKKRFVLHDERGQLCVYDNSNVSGLYKTALPINHFRYTRTGRKIGEFLKIDD